MSELFLGGEGGSAKGLIFRSLLQWDSSDCIRYLKVRIPPQSHSFFEMVWSMGRAGETKHLKAQTH